MEKRLLIHEIFHSIQGESSLAGLPFAFIRLTGCDLRCTYCDTTHAFRGGSSQSIAEILETVRPYQVQHVLVTGGEPLLQKNTPVLVQELAKQYRVSVETHGETSIEAVTDFAKIIMDIKTPSSGMSRGEFKHNFKFLKPSDEVKFVIGNQEDYLFARDLIESGDIPTPYILFSPTQEAKDTPGNYPIMPIKELAEKILTDRLPVRLQTQLHKLIWGADQKGV